ncbi:MAG: DUF5701 family protein [Cellulomonas sp.]
MPTLVTVVDDSVSTVRASASPAASAFTAAAGADAEFDRQVQTYLEVGFPGITGLTGPQFTAALEPLRAQVRGIDVGVPPGTSTPRAMTDDVVPFVVVVHPDHYEPNLAVPAMRRGRLRGVSVIDRDEAATYRPIDAITIPDGFAYVLHDVNTGTEFCNVRPESALATILGRGRTPLTIAEGLALVILRPDMLRPNRCFSLLASRTTNQRVPAIWISQRRPKLGWCWDRNPHTWLGSASVGARNVKVPPSMAD